MGNVVYSGESVSSVGDHRCGWPLEIKRFLSVFDSAVACDVSELVFWALRSTIWSVWKGR
jgi:hypothetical protein